jgi:hypothetical protein
VRRHTGLHKRPQRQRLAHWQTRRHLGSEIATSVKAEQAVKLMSNFPRQAARWDLMPVQGTLRRTTSVWSTATRENLQCLPHNPMSLSNNWPSEGVLDQGLAYHVRKILFMDPIVTRNAGQKPIASNFGTAVIANIEHRVGCISLPWYVGLVRIPVLRTGLTTSRKWQHRRFSPAP